jgi:predicted metal-binding membrane protein
MRPPVRPGLPQLLLSQRVLLTGGLAAVVAVSWAFLFWMAHDMASMPLRATQPGVNAGAMHGMGVGGLFAMWVVMMGAMMLPTAAPMAMLHARFQRGRRPDRSPVARTALFALGYLAAWSGFALLATAAQVELQRIALMHPLAMKLTSAPVAGVVLIVAGAFQLTPLKDACLMQCRTPLGFFMTRWRDGPGGAFSMGLHHGTFCVGCCWALMALMFVVGTMNMLWVGLLTAFVLLEKLGPSHSLVPKLSGLGLIAAGALLLAA